MKSAWLSFGLSLAMGVAPCLGAELGTVTVLEGPARLLRGPTWLKLAEGARIQEGDLLEVGARAQAQVELTDGGTLNLFGPAALYPVSVPLREGKLAGPAEFSMTGGWLKLAARAPRGGLRVRTALDTIATADAIAVVHAETTADEVFVESGTAQLIEMGKGGEKAASHDAKGGEFWSRAAGEPFTPAARPPKTFAATLPRHFIDPLPSRADRFRAAQVELAVDRDVTYAEAKPWLAGPYRKAFLKRLQPRLKNAAFRNAVEVDIHAYPEWDRILHPEKYLPKGGEKR